MFSSKTDRCRPKLGCSEKFSRFGFLLSAVLLCSSNKRVILQLVFYYINKSKGYFYESFPGKKQQPYIFSIIDISLHFLRKQFFFQLYYVCLTPFYSLVWKNHILICYILYKKWGREIGTCIWLYLQNYCKDKSKTNKNCYL